MSLSASNPLNKTSSGILVSAGYESIDYTDGSDTEEYLRQVLREAEDLSSTSMELENKIRDWPTEYHLSCRRANLFRGLNLSSTVRVLELGCGCGAITRYFGDQGLQVSAVEGSRERAEIAAARCAGLENVEIVCANFNELRFPRGTYDLIVFVGVLEYAGRFWPGLSNEEEATINILKTIRESLSDQGAIAIAIENRTGFKYVFGAHEDHYNKRYVGIDGYPNSSGVKTYTRNEWRSIINDAEFSESRYLYPFPDYKLPTLVMGESYAASEFGHTHLEGIASRDYVVNLDPGVHEPVFWQAASANGTLREFANSFLILIGDDASSLDKIADIDFVHLPDFRRRNDFNAMIRKAQGSELVERIPTSGKTTDRSMGLSQVLPAEPLLKGKLLSIHWSRSLLIDPWAEEFRSYLRRYYDYLGSQPLNIDLIPGNVVVSDTGEYQSFDREWETDYELCREYILFRALLMFGYRHKSMLGEFARRNSVRTVREFVFFGFGSLAIDVSEKLANFIEQEERFQTAANEIRIEDSVQTLLSTRLGQVYTPDEVIAKVYWKHSWQDYCEDRSVATKSEIDNDVATLTFSLPEDTSNITHIRFDPSDERSAKDVGFLRIYSLRIAALIDGDRHILLECHDGEAIAKAAALSGIVFSRAEHGEIFAVTGDNPEIEVDLASRTAAASCDHYQVEVKCSHIRSSEYMLIQDRFLIQEEVLRQELNDSHRANARLVDELTEIKNSKFWKVAQRYRSLLARSE